MLFLSARLYTNKTANTSLTLFIDGVPPEVEFNRGLRNEDRVTIAEKDFGDIWMNTAKDWSGKLRLNVTAVATRGKEQASSAEVLSVDIQAVADKPLLSVKTSCFKQSFVSLTVSSELEDKDGSESLVIVVKGVPHLYRLTAGRKRYGFYILLPSQLTGLKVEISGAAFTPFSLNITVASKEATNGNTANATATVDVIRCGLYWLPDLNTTFIVNTSKVYVPYKFGGNLLTCLCLHS